MRNFILLLLTFSCISVFADTANFNNYLSYADSQQGEAAESAKNLNPQATFKDYTNNPSQNRYYGGVTQSGNQGLDSDAASNVNQSDSGSAVSNDFKTRPVFKINPNSQAMQKGALIKDDSADISQGISDKYVNCQKAHNCTVKNITRTCDEETRFLTKSCIKTPKITITTADEVLTGNITPDDKFSGFLTIPEDGLVTVVRITAHVYKYLAEFTSAPGATLQGVVLSYQGGGEAPIFVNNSLNIPVKKGNKLEFVISGYPKVWWIDWQHKNVLEGASYSITIKKKVPHVDWQEVCNNVN